MNSSVFDSTTDNFIPAYWIVKTEDVETLRSSFKQFIEDEKKRLDRELKFLNGMHISDSSSLTNDLQGSLTLTADAELTRLLNGIV